MTSSMESSPELLRVYVANLFDEMEQRLALQRSVVMRCFDVAGSMGVTPREKILQDVLREVVDVLEETKQSFKSKRLGELRAKLERVLAEIKKP